MKSEPLERESFDSAELMRDHPPRWRHRNKQAVFEIACGSGHPFDGKVLYARWPEMPMRQTLTGKSGFLVHPGVFVYPEKPAPGTCPWHLNFSDPRLFIAYGSPLLAQDELQVAEHPILGALCEALEAAGRPGRTVDNRGKPTPITIAGAQRRCEIDTLPNPSAGRPRGLYGNAFARASVEEVMAATRPVSPPTVTNILAMAAPVGGRGDYSRDQINYVLTAAYTGFLATRLESEALAGAESRPVIHTGFWGCGAFGGNRTLMTILQAFTADLADVDLVFYAVDRAGASLAEQAHELYGRMRAKASSVPQFVDRVLERGFPWGVSDGN